MTKTFSIRFLAAAIFCLFLVTGQMFAQSTVTGSIRGNVTDPQGAIVPNANVAITNVNTNKGITTTADSNGGFRVTNLEPGTYSVKVNTTGFAEFLQERVIVEVGQVTTINVPLSVAGTTATVEVTAEAPVINTVSQDFSTNVNQTSINELPINGRRWSNFALLAPTSVMDGNFGLVSFRGISGLANNSSVDGGDNNQSFASEERGRTRIGYVVSQASIREFQVNTSNYSAEYGRSAGGVINAVTKSGTNEFHGQLFEYYKNNRFGARNPKATQQVFNPATSTFDTVGLKPVDIRHQFGGAIGGPIVKDRLFFFFSYDRQKRNFPGLSILGAVNGQPYLSSADTLLLTTPFGVQVPGRATGILGRGLTTAQVNNTLTFINSLTGESPRKSDQTIYFPKIDWQVNNNNLFTVSYNRLRSLAPGGFLTQGTNTQAKNGFGTDKVNVDSVNLRLQSTISASLLNEARFQYSRDFEAAFSQTPNPGEPLTTTTSGGPRSPNVTLTNGLSFGTQANFERNAFPDERRIQFADSITWIKGRHTFKFGTDIIHITDDIKNLRSQAGSYAYSNINDFIIDYTNYLTPFAAATAPFCAANSTRRAGKCYTSNYNQGIGIEGLKFSTDEYNFFAQDDFRITPRLTVNLGVRYEYQRMPKAIIPNSSTATIPNDGRTLVAATSTIPDDKNNFGPRLGLAYDLTGDGKTSIRAGYGIYYGRIVTAQIYNALLNTGNPGGQGQVSLNPAVVTSGAPIFPNVLPSNPGSLSLAGIQFYQDNFQAPLINQYDIIFERQIARNTAVSVSYLGSLGRNLVTFVDKNFNPIPTSYTTYTINGGPRNGQTFTLPRYSRANTAFAALTQIESSVKSQYNALVFQFNRRFTKGLQFQSSYTLARATDTGQNSSMFPSANSPLNVFDRSFDAGTSNFDVRHKIVASAVYSPKLYKGSNNSFGNYALNGWTISPIFIYFSGRPFDGFGGSNLNGTSGDSRFPLDERNAYRYPRLWDVDLRLSKRFKFTERYNLELIAEGFNIFNRTQVSQLNNTLYTLSGTTFNYSSSFGTIQNADNNLYRERQIQFAARFQF